MMIGDSETFYDTDEKEYNDLTIDEEYENASSYKKL
jgi:hypothetical protein